MQWENISSHVHGHSFMVERPGPDYLRNVDGIAGTDHGGLRTGSGLSLATRPGKDNYAHVSFPVTLGTRFELQGVEVERFRRLPHDEGRLVHAGEPSDRSRRRALGHGLV